MLVQLGLKPITIVNPHHSAYNGLGNATRYDTIFFMMVTRGGRGRCSAA